jgi:hypothetical protein
MGLKKLDLSVLPMMKLRLPVTMDSHTVSLPDLLIFQDSTDPPSVLLDGDLGDDNDDVLSSESSSGWNSTSSPGEFVNDEVVREWTSDTVNDADIYLMSQDQRGKSAVQVI